MSHGRVMFDIFRAALGIVVLSAVMIPGLAVAQRESCILDQDQSSFGLPGGCSLIVNDAAGPFERHQILAQTFTPASAGSLCRVSIHLSRVDGFDCQSNAVLPGNLVVEVRTTETGTALVFGGNYGQTTTEIPSNIVLASQTVAPERIPNLSTNWVDIDFSVPARVAPGVRYAVVLSMDGGHCFALPAGYCWVGARGPNGVDLYPSGQEFATSESLGLWSVSDRPSFSLFNDFLFKSYVEPIELSAQELIEALIGVVEVLRDSGVLNGGQAHALVVKLENASGKLDEGKPMPATGMVEAFVNLTGDYIDDGVLGAAEGQPLLEAAGQILDAITCGKTS